MPQPDGEVRISYAGPGGWEVVMSNTRTCRATLIEALDDAKGHLLKFSWESSQ